MALSKLTRESRAEHAAALRAEKNGQLGRGAERALAWLQWKIETQGLGHPPLPPSTVMHQIGYDLPPVPCVKRHVTGAWIEAEPDTPVRHKSFARTEGRGKNKRQLV